MKILITGGAGYIGSVLTGALLNRGLTVAVFDSFRYGGEGVLAYQHHPRFELIRGDLRCIVEVRAAMKNVNAVIHLAALVGDRACESEHTTTNEAFWVNVDGTQHVLTEAKKAGAKRFLFASTASCYGATDEMATEESSLQPLTQYALTKVAAEVVVRAENTDDFQAAVLRFATVFGLSPRMRFDLIVNQFVFEAVRKKELAIYSPEAWRSHIHISDLADALWAFTVTRQDIGGQTFNVGGFNRTKADLVATIENRTDVKVKYVDAGADNRDYQVSFDKLEQAQLLNVHPQFKARITPEQGVYEIVSALHNGQFWSPYSDRHVNT